MKQYEISSRLKAEKCLSLLQTPMTLTELADAMCLGRRGAQHWIDRLRDQIRILRYLPGSAHTPVYVAGAGKDASLKRMTRAQYERRYQKKLEKDVDRHERRKALERARYHASKKRPPATWISALIA